MYFRSVIGKSGSIQRYDLKHQCKCLSDRHSLNTLTTGIGNTKITDLGQDCFKNNSHSAMTWLLIRTFLQPVSYRTNGILIYSLMLNDAEDGLEFRSTHPTHAVFVEMTS